MSSYSRLVSMKHAALPGVWAGIRSRESSKPVCTNPREGGSKAWLDASTPRDAPVGRVQRRLGRPEIPSPKSVNAQTFRYIYRCMCMYHYICMCMYQYIYVRSIKILATPGSYRKKCLLGRASGASSSSSLSSFKSSSSLPMSCARRPLWDCGSPLPHVNLAGISS